MGKVLLEDHVVTDDGRQSQFGVQRRGEHEQEQQEQGVFESAGKEKVRVKISGPRWPLSAGYAYCGGSIAAGQKRPDKKESLTATGQT